MTKEQLLAAIAAPGLYIVATRRELIVIETDADGVQHQLKPASLRRDGVLAPDGWSDREDLIVVGPFGRLVPEPIDMVLHCPKCGLQHIDAPETDDDYRDKHLAHGGFDDQWTNPPHRTHMCHGCGHKWRPADVPTNGVAAVKTKGKADSPIAEARSTAAQPAGWKPVPEDPTEAMEQAAADYLGVPVKAWGLWKAMLAAAPPAAAQPVSIHKRINSRHAEALLQKCLDEYELRGYERGLASAATAQPLTIGEQCAIFDNPHGLRLLMDHQDRKYTEAEAQLEPYEIVLWPTARWTALRERGRSIMVEDLELWDDSIKQAFGFPPAASGDSTPPSLEVHMDREHGGLAFGKGDPSGAPRAEPEAVGQDTGVSVLVARYARLVKAAASLVAAVDERHDGDAPLKYTIPYGAVNELQQALLPAAYQAASGERGD